MGAVGTFLETNPDLGQFADPAEERLRNAADKANELNLITSEWGIGGGAAPAVPPAAPAVPAVPPAQEKMVDADAPKVGSALWNFGQIVGPYEKVKIEQKFSLLEGVTQG